MFKLKFAMLLAAIGLTIAPIAASISASAQGKCWHCYTNAYGKKICHDDCSCKGTH